MRVTYNLNFTGTLLAGFLLLIGFRSFLPFPVNFFPPHYFEFDMYVKSIHNLDYSSRQPDYYISVDNGEAIKVDSRSVEEILIGTLIQGDRWKIYKPIIEDFFCENRFLYNYNENNSFEAKIEIKYIQDNNSLVRKYIDAHCF